jgi:predicted metal-dependent hydrolase
MQRFRSIERDVVELALEDGRSVPVARVRDPRARRLKLSVDERGARLTLPPRASLAAGERFLAEHREWVAEQLANYAVYAGASLQPGVTAALPLRAQPLPLRWQEGRYARLRQDDDGLLFTLPAKASAASVHRALRDFYEGEARTDVGRWLPRYLPSLPRPPRRILLKVMSSQWGSLSPDDSVALDLALVLARPSAFEYVLVHELCHLLRPDHSRAFWREVEARFPAWRDERDWFHAHGRKTKAALRALLR